MSLLLLLASVVQVPDSARFAAAAERVLAARRHSPMRWPGRLPYGTAVASESGEVFLYNDIYGRDRALDQQLRRGFPHPR